MGLLGPNEEPAVIPLAGGVSSDIVRVDARDGPLCVKRALARLKVAADWEAPVGRNAAEADWLRTVAGWLPGAVPRLRGEDRARGLFAMDYLPADTHPVWKAELLAGRVEPAFAARVGAALGTIHGRSARDPRLPAAFANDATFEQIRLEPYLRATARAHPDLALRLGAIADRTAATRRVLVHGDVSPKNILHGPGGPVFLDAECACWGDPAFDLAFCLNHLLLKSVVLPARADAVLACFGALADSYLAVVDWEPVSAVEQRSATLLPALLLARVDGKSPVEYLDGAARADVRTAARALLQAPANRLQTVLDAWTSP